MGASFTPTAKHVEQYRRYRWLNVQLNNRLVDTIPRRAFEVLRDALEIDSEDTPPILLDCCHHDWYENGRNLVQRYVRAYPEKPGSDECLVAHATLRARFRVLIPRSAIAGAGLYFEDLSSGRELFLMDVALSQQFPPPFKGLATRTLPLGEYWMTGGAGVPIDPDVDLQLVARKIQRDHPELLMSPGMPSIVLARAALDSCSNVRITYNDPETPPANEKRGRR